MPGRPAKNIRQATEIRDEVRVSPLCRVAEARECRVTGLWVGSTLLRQASAILRVNSFVDPPDRAKQSGRQRRR